MISAGKNDLVDIVIVGSAPEIEMAEAGSKEVPLSEVYEKARYNEEDYENILDMNFSLEHESTVIGASLDPEKHDSESFLKIADAGMVLW